jgi:uncharacterized RDD family membrane protein YckC
MPLDETRYEYVGFWARVVASLIDTVLVCMLIAPLLTLVFGRGYWAPLVAIAQGGRDLPSMLAALDAASGEAAVGGGPVDFVLTWVLPAVAIIAFWLARQATPGKMVIGARIVDAETGRPVTRRQAIIRYLGYYVSLFGGFLGFFWVGWDRRKQGWHDKLAGTVVVRERRRQR